MTRPEEGTLQAMRIKLLGVALPSSSPTPGLVIHSGGASVLLELGNSDDVKPQREKSNGS